MWRAAVVMVAAAAEVVSGLFLEPLSPPRRTAYDKIQPAGDFPFLQIQRAILCPCASSVSGDYDPPSLNSLLPNLKHLYTDSHCKTLASLLSTHIEKLEDARGNNEGIPFSGVSDVRLKAVDRAVIMYLREKVYHTHYGQLEDILINPEPWYSQLDKCYSIASKRSPVLSSTVSCLYGCLQHGAPTVLLRNLVKPRNYAHILRKREASPFKVIRKYVVHNGVHISKSGNFSNGSMLENELTKILASKEKYEPNFIFIVDILLKCTEFLKGSIKELKFDIPHTQTKFQEMLKVSNLSDLNELNLTVNDIINQMNLIQTSTAPRTKETLQEVLKLMSDLASLDSLMTKDFSRKYFVKLKQLVDGTVKILMNTMPIQHTQQIHNTPRNHTIDISPDANRRIWLSGLGSEPFDFDKILEKLKLIVKPDTKKNNQIYDTIKIILYLLNQLQQGNEGSVTFKAEPINKYITDYYPDEHDNRLMLKDIQTLTSSKEPLADNGYRNIILQLILRLLKNMKDSKNTSNENLKMTLDELKTSLPNEDGILKFLFFLNDVGKDPQSLENLSDLEVLLKKYEIKSPNITHPKPSPSSTEEIKNPAHSGNTSESGKVLETKPNISLPLNPTHSTKPPITVKKIIKHPEHSGNTNEPGEVVVIKPSTSSPPSFTHLPSSSLEKIIISPAYFDNAPESDSLRYLTNALSIMGADKPAFNISLVMSALQNDDDLGDPALKDLMKFILELIFSLQGPTDEVIFDDKKVQDDIEKFTKKYFTIDYRLQKYINESIDELRFVNDKKLPQNDRNLNKIKFIFRIMRLLQETLKNDGGVEKLLEDLKKPVESEVDEDLWEEYTAPVSILQMFIGIINGNNNITTPEEMEDTMLQYSLDEILPYVDGKPTVFYDTDVNRVDTTNLRKLFHLIHSLSKDKLLFNAIPIYPEIKKSLLEHPSLQMMLRYLVDLVYSIQGSDEVVQPSYDTDLFEKELNLTINETFPYNKPLDCRVNEILEGLSQLNDQKSKSKYFHPAQLDVMLELIDLGMELHKQQNDSTYDIKRAVSKLKKLPTLTSKDSQFGLNIILLLHDILDGSQKFILKQDIIEALNKYNLEQFLPYFMNSDDDV